MRAELSLRWRLVSTRWKGPYACAVLILLTDALAYNAASRVLLGYRTGCADDLSGMIQRAAIRRHAGFTREVQAADIQAKLRGGSKGLFPLLLAASPDKSSPSIIMELEKKFETHFWPSAACGSSDSAAMR